MQTRQMLLLQIRHAVLCCLQFITQITIGAVNIRDVEQDAVNAASAGLVLLGLVNFALIIVLGKDFGYEAAQHYQQTGNNIQFQTSAPV